MDSVDSGSEEERRGRGRRKKGEILSLCNHSPKMQSTLWKKMSSTSRIDKDTIQGNRITTVKDTQLSVLPICTHTSVIFWTSTNDAPYLTNECHSKDKDKDRTPKQNAPISSMTYWHTHILVHWNILSISRETLKSESPMLDLLRDMSPRHAQTCPPK